MKNYVAAAIALLIALSQPAHAHRLDEYLQATILSVTPQEVDASLRMVPGVAVSGAILHDIDANRDGILSEAEQRAYAERVVHDLSLKVDGNPVSIQIVAYTFPSIEAIKQGTGEIQCTLVGRYSISTGSHRVSFENHYQRAISVYLVNALIPQDTHVVLGEQSRSTNQSSYQLMFTTSGKVMPSGLSSALSGFAGGFRLGMRHIAEGTDHLLFLLTLLLPAPLLATHHRWSHRASIQQTLLQMLRIVTAFTIGHSVTLLLSAFGWLQLPSRPIEVLIALSILVSAVNAMRPIFPGREALIAGSFGLIHGLAFASAISELGFTHWYKLVSVVSFNLGIETMQLAVVAAVLPSLLLLSRTPLYDGFRWIGSLAAVGAALGWILERAFHIANRLEPIVEQFAKWSPWLAATLFAVSLLAWASTPRNRPSTV